MRDPFKPRPAASLVECMRSAPEREAVEEAARAAQRLALWRHEQEVERALSEARSRLASRRKKP